MTQGRSLFTAVGVGATLSAVLWAQEAASTHRVLDPDLLKMLLETRTAEDEKRARLELIPRVLAAGPAALFEWDDELHRTEMQRRNLLVRLMPGVLMQYLRPERLRAAMDERRREPIERLKDNLRALDLETKLSAAWRLGEIGDRASGAASELHALMRIEHPATRYLSAWALSRIGPDALPKLLAIVDDPVRHPWHRAAAVAAIGWMGPRAESAVPTLVAHAHEVFVAEWTPRGGSEGLLAFRGIGEIALPALREALRDGGSSHIEQCIQAILVEGSTDGTVPSSRSQSGSADPTASLAPEDPIAQDPSASAVLLLLRELEGEPRSQAAGQLVAMASRLSSRARELLISQLNAEESRVRLASFRALYETRTALSPWRATIAKTLREQELARAFASELLLGMGALDELEAGLVSQIEDVRYWSASALARARELEPRMLLRFEALLEDPSARVVSWSLLALSKAVHLSERLRDRVAVLERHSDVGVRVQAKQTARRWARR